MVSCLTVGQQLVKNKEPSMLNLRQPVTSIKVTNLANWMSADNFFLSFLLLETLNLHTVLAGNVSPSLGINCTEFTKIYPFYLLLPF